MTISNVVEVTQDPPTAPPPPSITISVVTPAPPAHLASSGGPVQIDGTVVGVADGTTLHLFVSENGGTTWTDSGQTAVVASGAFSFAWDAGANQNAAAVEWSFEVSDQSPPA